ncbi:mannosyltransferase putative-domain-containing protein [Globomyces pollinis-pini]|nr:mannosyltransferase putative-domain-containing protein [Globomyces pollinis-pini]
MLNSMSGRRKRTILLLLSIFIFFTWYFTVKKSNDSEVLKQQKFIPKDSINFILSSHEKNLLSLQNDKDEISIHGNHLRLYSHVHSAILNNSYSNNIQLSHLAGVVDYKLFPWIMPKYSSTAELHQSYNGTGIVLCVNNGYTLLALTTMKMIRQNLKSNLPFEIFYVGDDDLSVKNRKLLEEIPFVTTKDITKIFNNPILKIEGWAIKPFALLASSFRHAMLMDADVVFLQSPEKLFNLDLYKKFGAFFFHDRSLFTSSDTTQQWVKDLVGEMTPTMKNLRLFNEKTGHEMESGVVVIDKLKNFVGLIAVCSLNSIPFRSQSYVHFHGDKETFWTGFESVRAPYSFNTNLPGVAGTGSMKDENFSICGMQLLHVDEQKRPLWINGGITKSKYDPESLIADLHEWASGISTFF